MIDEEIKNQTLTVLILVSLISVVFIGHSFSVWNKERMECEEWWNHGELTCEWTSLTECNEEFMSKMPDTVTCQQYVEWEMWMADLQAYRNAANR